MVAKVDALTKDMAKMAVWGSVPKDTFNADSAVVSEMAAPVQVVNVAADGQLVVSSKALHVDTTVKVRSVGPTDPCGQTLRVMVDTGAEVPYMMGTEVERLLTEMGLIKRVAEPTPGLILRGVNQQPLQYLRNVQVAVPFQRGNWDLPGWGYVCGDMNPCSMLIGNPTVEEATCHCDPTSAR